MKTCVVFGFCAIFLLIGSGVKAQEVNALLGDTALVQKEIQCILQRGPCDALGRQILRVLPEALEHDCRRCTPYQARNARRLISFMRESHPAEWNEIVRLHSRS